MFIKECLLQSLARFIYNIVFFTDYSAQKQRYTECRGVLCDNKHPIFGNVCLSKHNKFFFYKLRSTGSKVVLYDQKWLDFGQEPFKSNLVNMVTW